VVISLAGSRTRLTDAVMAAVAEATRRIDVRSHRGVHPRVGAADVVPITPLGSTTLDECLEVARVIGGRIWAELKVPVYFYGYGTDRTLAEIRGGRARPDLGAGDSLPGAGAACVGARPLLIAFNVLLPRCDLVTARALARSIRESSGGMRGVQALVFELSEGRIQLSMNLIRAQDTRPHDVLAALRDRGVAVGEQQLVGLCPAEYGGDYADGRLLEARLAASAARAGAATCRARGGEEHMALAARLDKEAAGLSNLGADQESLLAGAERAGALAPVLRVAGVLDGELFAMLDVAARGFAAALTSETRAGYAARTAALDRRLADL
jgi:glutamate formiminotransferase / 5-formyltetrahydrofolate cyclo-ligase